MTLAFQDSLAVDTLGVFGGSSSPMDTTGATLLVVAINRSSTGTFSDSESNTWTLLHTVTIGGASLEWYYCISPTTNASHTFTYAGLSTYPSLCISAYTGATVTFDKKSSGSSASSTSASTGSVTPTEDRSLIVSAVAHSVAAIQSVSESMTIRENIPYSGGNRIGGALADKIQTTKTAINPTWSSAATSDRMVAVAVFTQPALARKPLVLVDGEITQLSSAELLDANVSGGTEVSSDSEFTTDNAILVVDGTSGRKAKEVTSITSGTINGLSSSISTLNGSVGAIQDDYVSAAATFDTDNVLLRSDGTTRGAQKSTAAIADTGALTLNQASSLETSGTHVPVFSVLDSTATPTFVVNAFLRSSGNLSIGSNAGQAITSGTNNTLFGNSAGLSINSGGSNVCLGGASGDAITTGSNNFALGVNSLSICTTGNSNVAIGTLAMQHVITGINNVGIGTSAANGITGSGNVCIGVLTGDDCTAGSNNVFVGLQAGDDASQANTVTNSIAIGYKSFTTANNQAVLGASSITSTILRGAVHTGSGAYETLKRVSKTASASITNETMVLVDATSGAVTITLPAASTLVDTPVHIKKTDASGNAVTVDGDGAETIDGATTKSLAAQYDKITIVSDGTTWWVL